MVDDIWKLIEDEVRASLEADVTGSFLSLPERGGVDARETRGRVGFSLI